MNEEEAKKIQEMTEEALDSLKEGDELHAASCLGSIHSYVCQNYV